MEVTIRSMRREEDMNQNAAIGMNEQHRKASEEVAERKELKAQYGAGKQQETAYNKVSPYGDTLSISEVGRVANSEKGNKSGSKDTTDGIVIRKEEEANEQESDVSTVNLSAYTKQELKQMYLDGDITRTEYDKEISSREMQG